MRAEMRTKRIDNANDSIFGSVGHEILAEVLQRLDGSDRELMAPTDLKPTGGVGHVCDLRAIDQFAQCHSQLPPGWNRRVVGAFNLVVFTTGAAHDHNKHPTTLPTMQESVDAIR